LAFWLGLSLGASPAWAGGADPYLDFAQQLFNEGDYYRAITEAKRFIFLNPNHDRGPEAHLLVARANYEAGDLEKARESYLVVLNQGRRPDLAARAVMELGLVMEKLGRTEDALAYYQGLEQEPDLPGDRDSDMVNTARYRRGWLLLEQGRWEEARQAFDRVEEGHALKDSARELSQRSTQGVGLSHRSPGAAGLMSAVLPGSGQLYVGRPMDAALAFILNGVFVWGTVEAFNDESWAVFGLLGLMELGWYGGNIYNAVNGAHIHNREAQEAFLKSLRRDQGWRLGYSPQQQGVVLSWTTKY
jgi:tetratricopeptide (TPR) repeat protein